MPICPACASELHPGSRFCSRCGTVLIPGASNPAALPPAGPLQFRNLNGIDGWLILIAISLAFTPFVIARRILRTDLPIMLAYGTLAAHSVGVAFVVRNLMTIAGLVLINILFYLKRRTFPLAMIVYWVWQILTHLGEFALYATVLQERNATTIMRILSPLIGAAIWIPYLLLSRRVKATFVR